MDTPDLSSVLKERRPIISFSVFSKVARTTFESSCFFKSSQPTTNPEQNSNNALSSSQHMKANGTKEKTPDSLKETRISHPSNVGLTCTVCKITFDSVQEQRSHFKLDWHRLNLKYLLAGRQILKEEEFEENVSDLSSISGSDTDSGSSSESEPEEGVSDVPGDDNEGGTETQIEGHKRPHSHNRVYFMDNAGKIYSMYKCLLQKTDLESKPTLEHLNLDKEKDVCTILAMMSGGHFAAGIFHWETLIEHKTFHRYTIRAKRGTTQSVHDNNKFARSAGASIRRHNEVALADDIKDLFAKWSSHIEHASLIFVKCPAHAKSVFFGKGRPFARDDSRIRKIPFMSRRPTLKEVQRVFIELTSIRGYEDDVLICNGKNSCAKDRVIDRSPSPKSSSKNDHGVKGETMGNADLREGTEEDVKCQTDQNRLVPPRTGDRHTKADSDILVETLQSQRSVTENFVDNKHFQDTFNRLSVLGDKEDCMSMEAVLQKYANQTDETCLLCQCQKTRDDTSMGGVESCPNSSQMSRCTCTIERLLNHKSEIGHTLLHKAALNGNHGTVWFLLQHGADPSVNNNRGKPPYLLAKTKEVRNTFRRFMAEFPSKYNYQTSQIPSPLTASMEEERSKKAVEKKKAQRKTKKERDKAKKLTETRDDDIDQKKLQCPVLSEREKRAIAAEKRFELSKKERCANCTNPVNARDAFERFQFIYCSTNCVQEHKSKIGR